MMLLMRIHYSSSMYLSLLVGLIAAAVGVAATTTTPTPAIQAAAKSKNQQQQLSSASESLPLLFDHIKSTTARKDKNNDLNLRRNLARGDICYNINEFECGEYILPLDPGCSYLLADSYSSIICPDKCGPGIDLYASGQLYCLWLNHLGYGTCNGRIATSVDGCTGEVNADDLCSPIGCNNGGGGTTGGDLSVEDICTFSADGTSVQCTPFPTYSLTTLLTGCDEVTCANCQIADEISGVPCNSCSFCTPGDPNSLMAFDCTNLNADVKCGCDGNCEENASEGTFEVGGGGGSTTTDLSSTANNGNDNGGSGSGQPPPTNGGGGEEGTSSGTTMNNGSPPLHSSNNAALESSSAAPATLLTWRHFLFLNSLIVLSSSLMFVIDL